MDAKWRFRVENFLLSVQVYFLFGFPGGKKEFEKYHYSNILLIRNAQKKNLHPWTTHITKLNRVRNSDTIMQKMIVALNFGAK
jgi:hypothetical protein